MRKKRETHFTMGLSPKERHFGCIVSCIQEDGQRMNLHRGGSSGQALREIVDYLDRLDDEWRIEVISTPVSVFRDLNGSRDDDGADSDTHINWPERLLLGRLGRLDLWAGAPVSENAPPGNVHQHRRR